MLNMRVRLTASSQTLRPCRLSLSFWTFQPPARTWHRLLAWTDAYVAEREGAKVIDLVEISHMIMDAMIVEVINQ